MKTLLLLTLFTSLSYSQLTYTVEMEYYNNQPNIPGNGAFYDCVNVYPVEDLSLKDECKYNVVLYTNNTDDRSDDVIIYWEEKEK